MLHETKFNFIIFDLKCPLDLTNYLSNFEDQDLINCKLQIKTYSNINIKVKKLTK